ncbi:GNAT family N-acetyltransferase [Wolbachia endosymbiont of Ctenocephalides felis wCfeT]|uniref:GNAT family N-acetyltransferase n=1 Tax=Wolbachia endosymbiont of Ctenocephalides felis wCfeT TaxID=2732593 RepID=UPI00144561BD|nr:GNAT family N-acetyltransferase [Wolbachia endosymbiont of Ctenocephalides felis wCfeT]
MKFTVTTSLDSEKIDFLSEKLNEEFIDKGACSQFAFFTHDENDQVIAGCSGLVIYGSIYTDLLWVHQDHRKKGLGYQLMEKVHEYGRNMHCKIATLVTMSFQGAKGFYENLGYECDFERSGYVDDSTLMFLKKIL